MTSEMTYIERCARQLRQSFQKGKKIIVEKSTVPVQTSELIRKILCYKNNNEVHFDILSNPEFLAEGTAIHDLTHPDRIIIGGDSETEAMTLLTEIYAKWIPREKILHTSITSSELSKLVANALLAQRVSSINAVSALCEAVGGNVHEISSVCGMDSRIGKKFLNASVGFGGSCFQKDILSLCYLCEHHGLPEVSEYFKQIIRLNEFQRERFVKRIVQAMFGSLFRKKLVIMGFAFKKDTSDTRESASIFVCRSLLEERAHLIVHDPKVLPKQAILDLARALNNVYDSNYLPMPLTSSNNVATTEEDRHQLVERNVTFENQDIYKAVQGADALIVLTEWDQFKSYDYLKIYDLMEKPAFIFDGRNILDHAALKKIGFETFVIGVGELGKH